MSLLKVTDPFSPSVIFETNEAYNCRQAKLFKIFLASHQHAIEPLPICYLAKAVAIIEQIMAYLPQFSAPLISIIIQK
jgi:hypothetical protein